VNKLAGTTTEFKADDVEAVARFCDGFDMALPYIRRGASVEGWMSVLLNRLLPGIATYPEKVGTWRTEREGGRSVQESVFRARCGGCRLT